MELRNLNKLEKKASHNSRVDFTRLGAAMLFMFAVLVYATAHTDGLHSPFLSTQLVIAALIGAYMAMNIGANDVANNMGPTVGSKALTMAGAIAIAAAFEMLGAVVAGGDVVATVKSGIIDPSLVDSSEEFVLIMMSALLAGALWLNLATVLGAPVSTTHSIVGAVMGAGIASGGLNVVQWLKLTEIVSSWVISPLLGGVLAAVMLYMIKRTITYKKEMTKAAIKVVPLLVAFMAWAFCCYMLIKGLGASFSLELRYAVLVALPVAVTVFLIVRVVATRTAIRKENSKESVNALFGVPLIFSAALLSFAHGANDVANAIGPLAAINETLVDGALSQEARIPLWIMLLGAAGLALGLALYGPKLIKTVGGEITDLDKMRAYCIAMSAALTVILASWLGMPVSTTHVAIGAVFGVGFLREYLKSSHARMIELIVRAHEGEARSRMEAYLARFNAAPLAHKERMLNAMKKKEERKKAKALASNDPLFSKKERKVLKRAYKNELVKRSAVNKIVAAWLITVPVAALLSALLYFVIGAILL
ncbi:MAG: inorganic phosphate transporter [Helicobacteraceae bacterium]|nr:inorganic phosphate transporter [Helicobacteraceae bacterium]